MLVLVADGEQLPARVVEEAEVHLHRVGVRALGDRLEARASRGSGRPRCARARRVEPGVRLEQLGAPRSIRLGDLQAQSSTRAHSAARWPQRPWRDRLERRGRRAEDAGGRDARPAPRRSVEHGPTRHARGSRAARAPPVSRTRRRSRPLDGDHAAPVRAPARRGSPTAGSSADLETGLPEGDQMAGEVAAVDRARCRRARARCRSCRSYQL